VNDDHRCLLTGATGFIGSHLAARLAAEGYRLRCVVRETSDTSLLRALGVEVVLGDLKSPESLAEVASGCGVVVHAGAIVSDWATVREISQINVDGTRALLHASIAAGVRRFLHISSTDVYGHPGVEVDESYQRQRFANWYSETKLLAEHEVWRAASRGAIDVVVVRPATVYGPRSTSVVGEIGNALRNRSMLLVDGGRTTAGLCYVENLSDLIVLCIGADAASGEAFNVTDRLHVTWRRFTDDLAAGIGAPPASLSMPYPLAGAVALALEHGYRAARRATGITIRPLLSRQAVQVMGRNQRFSTEKAARLLGWHRRVGYEQGLEATLAWLRATVRDRS
jgi:oxidoreductase